MEILLVGVLVALYFIYKKIEELFTFFQEEENKYQKSIGEYESDLSVKQLLKYINLDLRNISGGLTKVSHHLQSTNPVGKKSADYKLITNLQKEYADILVEKKKISKKEALLRAGFEIGELYRYDIDKLIVNVNSDSFSDGVVKKKKEDMTNSFIKSDILDKDIASYLKNNIKVIPHDLLAPLYFLIKKSKCAKGDKVQIDYSEELGSIRRYDEYLKHRVIVTLLVKLKILKWIGDKDWNNPKFELLIDDMNKLRKIIYSGESSHEDSHFEGRFRQGELDNYLTQSWL
jgi:hypothetical protein